jgi:hypothetical protein
MPYVFVPDMELTEREQELLIEMHIDLCARLRLLDQWEENPPKAAEETLTIEKLLVRIAFERDESAVIVAITADRLRKIRTRVA